MTRKVFMIIFSLFFLISCGNSKEKEEKKVINDKNDLKGLTIGVLIGSIQDQYATDSIKDCTVLRLENTTDTYTALRNGVCDVVISDYSNYLEASDVYDDISIAIDNLWGKTPCGIAFNKKDAVLRGQFNKFLKELHDNGIYDDMYDRWVENYVPEATVPPLPLPEKGEKLIFGVAGIAPRYSFFKDDRWEGFEIELTQRFSVYLGRPIEVQMISFSGLITALVVGKVDMIGSLICITEERSKQVDFSDPTVYERSVVAFCDRSSIETGHPATNENLNWKEFFDGKKVGVLVGSMQDQYVSNNSQNTEIIRFEDHAYLSQALQAGQCDVIVEMNVIADLLEKNNPTFQIYRDTLYTDHIGVGFRKEDTLLCHQFNTFLHQIQKEPVWNEMENRWLNSGFSGDPVEINLPKEGTPLRVGIIDGQMGFSFIKENKIVGFEPEMVERFAKSLNRSVEYVCVSFFTSLMPLLVTEKVDMIASTITITPERAKSILFSDPYYAVDIVPVYRTENIVKDKVPFLQRTKESFVNNLILEKRYLLIWEGLKETIVISLLSILLGTLLGCGICYMRMRKNRLVRGVASIYIMIMRGIPMLVLLMIMFYVVFVSSNISPTMVAVLTFSINFAAYVSEMFRTSIESIDKGQSEAGIAMGFSKIKTFFYIVVPQSLRNVMPVYKGEVISLIKGTSIVGYIAIHDLTKASDIIRSRTFDAFFPLIFIAIIYFILAWLCIKLLDYLFTKTISRKI